MKLFTIFLLLFLCIPLGTLADNSTITFFFHKYPYFKIHDPKNFDHEKYSKKLQQPGYLYRKITQPQHFQSTIPGIMSMYDGHVAISDHNGQIIHPRKQQTKNIYILVTKGIKPAYIIAPSTIHNWMIDPEQPSKNYQVEFRQDDELELYYFDTQEVDLPADGNIPRNTIIIIANHTNVLIPLGATITELSSNLILPNIYIKREFCFTYNSLYTLAIKQYFDQDANLYQLENLTVSQIQQ